MGQIMKKGMFLSPKMNKMANWLTMALKGKPYMSGFLQTIRIFDTISIQPYQNCIKL